LAKLEINKQIRKSVKRVGVQRFFTGLIFLIGGLVWKFFQFNDNGSSGITLQKILSFWPVFWTLWMGGGFLWWVLSGFKSVNGLIFSFVGGAFMAETVMPGVVINTDNGPYFIILMGLFLFALPRKNYQTTAYSYGTTKNFDKMNVKSNTPKMSSSSIAEQKRDSGQTTI
jgi:hypothetical protein